MCSELLRLSLCCVWWVLVVSNPLCWTGEFTEEACCGEHFGSEGNPDCWGMSEQGLVIDAKLCCSGLWRPRPCWDWKLWKDWIPRFAGWRISSQSDQDSVLFLIFSIIGVTNMRYVEFGVNDAANIGTGSNTALLQRSKWRILPQQINRYRSPHIQAYNQHWRGVLFDIENENSSICLFKEAITPGNVVDIFKKYRVPLEVDYVSIDVDSCDVWIFLALAETYRPRVVTVEYSWLYPMESTSAMACTDNGVPDDYDLYKYGMGWLPPGHGASLRAVWLAAQRRGYAVVWVTCGLDVYLVREDLLCAGSTMTSDELAKLFSQCTGILVEPPVPPMPKQTDLARDNDTLWASRRRSYARRHAIRRLGMS